jgi:hypothetical protein
VRQGYKEYQFERGRRYISDDDMIVSLSNRGEKEICRVDAHSLQTHSTSKPNAIGMFSH